MAAIPLAQIGVHLRPNDNIAVTAKTLAAGSEIQFNGSTLKLPVAVKMGHKFAVHPIKEGDAIYKYGQIIGFAGRDIPAGDHVHVHNVKLGSFERDYAFCSDYPTSSASSSGISHLHGLRSRSRQARSFALRHPQLSRHHQHRELFGEHEQVHLRARPGAGHSGAIPECRRRRGDRSQARLRHGLRRRRITSNSTARWPVSPAIPTSAAISWLGWAAKPVRRST